MIDSEKIFANDPKEDTKEEGVSQDESSINVTTESSINVSTESFNDEDSNDGGGQDMSCRPRRFTSPTLLGYSGFFCRETQQLTAIAEVHEDATDNY